MQNYQFAYVYKKASIGFLQASRGVGPVTSKIHMHNREELLLITSEGACRLTNNGNIVTVNTPALVFNRAGSFHETLEVFEKPMSCFVCSYHPQVFSGIAQEYRHEEQVFQNSDMLIMPLTRQQTDAFIPLFSMMKARPLSQKRFLLLCVLDQMAQLLAEGLVPIRTSSKQTYIFEVVALLQNTESGNLTLAQLAERFHVSQTKLKNDFKKLTSMPIHMFRRHVQLQTARMLLETTQTELAQIAYSCGFSDESYFIRAFRKEYGITPGAYRKQQKQ